MTRKLFGTDGVRGVANRIPMTAEDALQLGRAVGYRLRKLQAIANMDLDDPEKRLHLLISIWILDRQK